MGHHCLKGTSSTRPDTVVSGSLDSYSLDTNQLDSNTVDPRSVESVPYPTLVDSDPEEEDPNSVDLTTGESSSRSPMWQQKRDSSIPIASRIERRMKGVEKDAASAPPPPMDL